MKVTDIIAYAENYAACQLALDWLKALPADMDISEVPAQPGFDFGWAAWWIFEHDPGSTVTKRYLEAAWIIDSSTLEEASRYSIAKRLLWTTPYNVQRYRLMHIQLLRDYKTWLEGKLEYA